MNNVLEAHNIRRPTYYYLLLIINRYDEAEGSKGITFILSSIKIGELFQTFKLEYA
jgi:hypothetical protein